VLVYEMLTGNPPFESNDVRKVYNKILTREVKYPRNLSTNALDLMERVLVKDPENRLSDPVSIKAHPFFDGIDWEKLSKKEMAPPCIPEKDLKESIESAMQRDLNLEESGLNVKFEAIEDRVEIISDDDQKLFDGF